MRCLPAALALLVCGTGCRGGAEPVEAVRIYALDCGSITLDGVVASTDSILGGNTGRMVDVCYLIRHPKGDLLWDLGLGDDLARHPGKSDQLGDAAKGIHLAVDRTLADQLAEIDLAPADIEYIAFSHLHFDHTGNANLFPAATWLVNRRELAWGQSKPTPFGVNPSSWSDVAAARTRLIDNDLDVFGDGTVRVLGAPGHTPGHQVLLVTFAQGGAVLLGGDLYQTRDNVKTRRVPAVAYSKSDMLASFDRIAGVLASSKATLIVQHAPEDLASLPKFPLYLE